MPVDWGIIPTPNGQGSYKGRPTYQRVCDCGCELVGVFYCDDDEMCIVQSLWVRFHNGKMGLGETTVRIWRAAAKAGDSVAADAIAALDELQGSTPPTRMYGSFSAS